MRDVRMKVLKQAQFIPDGAEVSKPGERTKYILGRELAGWEYGNQKRDPIKATNGYNFLIENVTLGIGSLIPGNQELVWYATHQNVIDEAEEMW